MTCWCGEIGRRKGLKILRGKPHTGSSPVTSTRPAKKHWTLLSSLFSVFNFYKREAEKVFQTFSRESDKRVAAIHDISCVGRCSLTAALPLLSAVGIETNIIPTAILSTHTGGFTGYTYRDLTEDMLPIAQHWNQLHLKFDALYTGYIGTLRQLELLNQIIALLKAENTLLFIDPVMADNGALYKCIQPEYVEGMRNFVRQANLITPNMTEAMLLLNMEYTEGPYSEKFVSEILRRLSEFGNDYVVLTGVSYDRDRLGAVAYDCRNDQYTSAFSRVVKGTFHGSGDVFASVLLGAVLNGKKLEEALKIAVDFTVNCITTTKKEKADLRYGLHFEKNIPHLIRDLGLL